MAKRTVVRHVNPLAPASLILAVCGACASAGWIFLFCYGAPLAGAAPTLLALGFVAGITIVGWAATFVMGIAAAVQIQRSYGCQRGGLAAVLAILLTIASVAATLWFVL